MPKALYNKIMTPLVSAKYLHIAEQDTYEGQECGYSITISLNPAIEEHKLFIDRVEEAVREAAVYHDSELPASSKKQYNRHSPLKDEIDSDGNQTGMVLFKATTKVEPSVINAAVQPVPPSYTKGMRKGTKVVLKALLKSIVLKQRKSVGCVAYIDTLQIVEPVYGAGSTEGFSSYETTASSDAYATQAQSASEASAAPPDDTDDIPF